MDWAAIIIAVISGALSGGGVVAALLVNWQKRKFELEDKKDILAQEVKNLRNEIIGITAAMEEVRRDALRNQIITMIYHKPENHDTIMEMGKTYFITLGGNWYLDSEFREWAKREGVALPTWFKSK